MSRRHAAKKREVLPDPRFKDKTIAKFINYIMLDGKKSTAEGIVYGALDTLSSKLSVDPVESFLGILDKVRPSIEVKSRRVGGATYQVPVEVKQTRGIVLAMRWIKDAANKRNEKTMTEKLAGELLDAQADRGASIKKRDDTIKMAEANQAFAHFRW